MKWFYCLMILIIMALGYATEDGKQVIAEVETAIYAYDRFVVDLDFEPALAATKKGIEAVKSYTWPEQNGASLPLRSAIYIERFRSRISWIIEHYKNNFEFNPDVRSADLAFLDEGMKHCQRFKVEIIKRIPLPASFSPVSTMMPRRLRTIEVPGRQPTKLEQARIDQLVQLGAVTYKGMDTRELFKLQMGYTNEEMHYFGISRVIELKGVITDVNSLWYTELRDNIIPSINANPGQWHYYESRQMNIGHYSVECNRFAYLIAAAEGKFGVQAYVNLALNQNRGSVLFCNETPCWHQDGLDVLVRTSVSETQMLLLRLFALKDAMAKSEVEFLDQIDPQKLAKESERLAELIYSDAEYSRDLIAKIISKSVDFRKIVNEECVTLGYVMTASVDNLDSPLLRDSMLILEHPVAGRIVWCGKYGQRLPFNFALTDPYHVNNMDRGPQPKPIK